MGQLDTFALNGKGSVMKQEKVIQENRWTKSAVEKKMMWSDPHPIRGGNTDEELKYHNVSKIDEKWNTAMVREAAADVQSEVLSVGPGEDEEEEGKEEDRKRGGVRLCLKQKLSSACTVLEIINFYSWTLNCPLLLDQVC